MVRSISIHSYSGVLTLSFLIIAIPFIGFSQSSMHIKLIKKTKGLIALWTFAEKPGGLRKAIGAGDFPLSEVNGVTQRSENGPLSGYAIELKDSNYLSIGHQQTKLLNIHGQGASVTVIAWIKWRGEGGFIGGMWNEYSGGGKRQYGLFVNLGYYNGKKQVCGHTSLKGGPTPPFPFSIDYAASKQQVPVDEWACVAFTYDGTYIRSYLNGIFEAREAELIDHTTGFPGFPSGIIHSKNPYYFPDGLGNNGSDFTVGAVRLKNGMGNFFRGQIGGLAVFNRCLSAEEMKKIAVVPLGKW